MIMIHTPMKCQNGHDNTLVTHFASGDVLDAYWLEKACPCPKGELGEGYAPSGEDHVVEVASLTDKGETK